MKPSSGRAAGFTLIELLIVLALMGVLMVIGIPNLYAFIQRQKILGIAQQTAIAFRLARLQSIKTSTAAVVTIDTVNRNVVVFDDASADRFQNNGEKTVALIQIPKGITFVGAFGLSNAADVTLPNVAVFRSDGSVTDVGGFRFSNAKGDQLEARVLTPKSTARVQIVKLQGAVWKAQGEGGQSWTWN
jgi:type IV fimbrial biogenesis protein FimT